VQRTHAERLENDAIMHAHALRSWGNLLATGLALLAALVLWATLRALMNPVRLLVAGTAAIDRGDFGHRIRYRSHNELGLLTPEKYARLIDGTFFLDRAGNQTRFAKAQGFGSVFGSSEAVDKFNIDNHIYKDSASIDALLDANLVRESKAESP
jgi:HAMP domain-containing protein